MPFSADMGTISTPGFSELTADRISDTFSSSTRSILLMTTISAFSICAVIKGFITSMSTSNRRVSTMVMTLIFFTVLAPYFDRVDRMSPGRATPVASRITRSGLKLALIFSRVGTRPADKVEQMQEAVLLAEWAEAQAEECHRWAEAEEQEKLQ